MRNHLIITTTLCFVIAWLFPFYAAGEDVESREPDFDMPTTHIEVRVHPPDAVPKPDLLPDDAQLDTASDAPTDPIEALHHEVQTLRDELRMLQGTLDLMVNKIMEDLREENELLRKEMRRMHAMQERFGLPDMSLLPRPGMDLFDEILFEDEWPEDEWLDDAAMYDQEPPEERVYTDEPFAFTPLHEWGRTPDMAEQLGDDTPSLLGLVGVVPRNSRRADIEALGRQLRDEYDGYDNINIEVFDGLEAAERFIETQVGDPARRVLSISKHRGDGRDVILFLENGEADEVARTETDAE